MDILPQKQNSPRIFLRRIQKYRFLVYIFLILILTFVLARRGSLFRDVELFPIRNFVVESIDGQKTQYVTAAELKDVFEEVSGKSFLAVDVGSLSNKVKKESPFIKDLIVTKNFPSTVTVSVVERLPVTVVQVDNINCAVLDYEAHVLEESEVGDDGCKEMEKNYSVPLLYLDDSKVVFKVNEQSSFYVIKDMYKMILVLDEYGYVPQRMVFEDQVLTISLKKEREVVFSLNQSVDTQLERLIAVVGQLRQDGMDFTSLDLRYERPVLKQN